MSKTKKILNYLLIIPSLLIGVSACTDKEEPSAERSPSAFFVDEDDGIRVISKEFKGHSRKYQRDENGELIEIKGSRNYHKKIKTSSENPANSSQDQAGETAQPISDRLRGQVNKSVDRAARDSSIDPFKYEKKRSSETSAAPPQNEADPNYNTYDGSPVTPKHKPTLESQDRVLQGTETSEAKEVPDFLRPCISTSTGVSERKEFCQNTLSFIANRVIEPHKDKKDIEVKQQFNVGKCNFNADLTLMNGQIVGADNLDGVELSYVSVANSNNRNALDAKPVPFRKILEAANVTCDNDVLVISEIDFRTLNKLKSNSYNITNVAPFLNFFNLLDENPGKPFETRPEVSVGPSPSDSTR